jgi:hypothetical protein
VVNVYCCQTKACPPVIDSRSKLTFIKNSQVGGACRLAMGILALSCKRSPLSSKNAGCELTRNLPVQSVRRTTQGIYPAGAKGETRVNPDKKRMRARLKSRLQRPDFATPAAANAAAGGRTLRVFQRPNVNGNRTDEDSKALGNTSSP